MSHQRDRRHGQSLVIFALMLVAAMGMVGLIVDGGNAYSQQRGTQNGADSAATSGATAIAHAIMGAATGTTTSDAQLDANVLAAMNAAAQDNAIKPFDLGTSGNSVAYYTDVAGNPILVGGNPVQVGSGAVPACTSGCIGGRAVGVQAFGQRAFNTYVSGVIGVTGFTATAQATAVAGYEPPTGCSATQGCALLPVTFAVQQATCDSSGNAVYDGAWGFPVTAYTPVTESILSLCKKGDGAFGFIDFGCAPNLAQQISSPCNLNINLPTWLQSQPGNTNAVENALNAYAGCTVGLYEGQPLAPCTRTDQVVQIPFFDAICHSKTQPDPSVALDKSTFPWRCVGDSPGGGNYTWYHIPYFLGFILDHAYVQGNNFPDCNTTPGSPLPGGNGSGGCLKGWGASITLPPGPVPVGTGSGGPGTPLRIQLIK